MKLTLFKLPPAVLFAALMVTPALAIKITVPKQYEEQVEAIKKAEKAERQRQLEGVEAGGSADSGGLDFTVTDGEQADNEPKVGAGEANEFLKQSLNEAASTANEFAEEAPENMGFVSGQIVDKESGQPLSGVAILLDGTDIGTMTNSDGRYTLGPAPAGEYTINFVKSGYIPANVAEFAVAAGEVSVFPFALPPRPAEMSDQEYVLQDFTVTAEEANQLMMELDLRRDSLATMDMLSSEDFSKFAASDAAEAISKMSGASLSDGKYVVMRGLNDRYNTTLINGVRLPSPDPDRKAVAMDIFPTSLFEGITVQKTYTSDLPGESSGGSVGLKTKSVPEEPFIKFSFSAGGQMTSGDTDVFLADPEQISLGEWLKGEDRRDFDVRPGTTELVDDYPNSVGGAGFPLTAPRIKRMSKFGDRSYNLSFGGSREVRDWLTLGAVVGVKVDEKRRTSFKEGLAIDIDEGVAVVDFRARKEDTRLDANGNVVQHGGELKSEEEYSTSALVGLGAQISDHTTLNYTFLRSETMTSSAKRIDYQEYEESGPVVSGVVGLPDNTFYSYTDYEVGSEEKLLEAHQFSGEHKFDLLRLSEWKFSWYHTMASMSQSEPDQRLIAEFIPDQFGLEIDRFASDPGLPPVTRFQRETEQDSTMNGLKIEQEVELTDSISFGFNFGYDNEASEREFRQLEARIAQDQFVDDPLFAAMPYPNQSGLNDVVDPNDLVNPIFRYNDGFVDENLLNGVNEVIEALYNQEVGNANNSFSSLSTTLATRQTTLNSAQSSLTSAENDLNSAITQFETTTGVDYETQFNPGNPLHVLLFTSFISPREQTVITQQAAVNTAQTDFDATQAQVNTAQTNLNTITAEQAQYLNDAAALIAQISSMPALAMDATAFPTFSFFDDQSYILDTPRGFSVYADESPTAANIQFNDVNGLFQANGENEVRSFYISGNLTFSNLPLVESLRVASGMRSESTKLSYELIPNAPGEPNPVSGDGAGVSPFVVESSSIDQRDRLGYLAFIFDITDSLKLHLSKSTTIAKPTFREIAPFPIFNLSDKSFEQGNAGLMLRSASGFDDWKNRTGDFAGKSDSELPQKFVVPVEFAGLKIAEVESFDIRLEYFTPLDGLISLGYFTKTIGAPIERVFAYESSNVAVNTFINNNNDAELEGIEFELQQNLGVLGDEFFGIPLGWFTIGGNYTKLDAEVTRSAFEMQNLSNARFNNQLTDPDLFQTGGQYATRPLYNQPTFVANAFVSLDLEKTGTRITLSQNWLGEQLIRAGGISESQEGGQADLYWDEFSSMNLVIEQEINDTWSMKFAIKNLDSPVRKAFQKDIFFQSLNDGALYDQAGGNQLAPMATGANRSSQKIEPTYSISISASF